jgi:uncharacterized membrane protein YqhA
MIDKWGTEVAIVIAILGVTVVNYLFRFEHKTNKQIWWFLMALNVMVTVVAAMYGYARYKGVDL